MHLSYIGLMLRLNSPMSSYLVMFRRVVHRNIQSKHDFGIHLLKWRTLSIGPTYQCQAREKIKIEMMYFLRFIYIYFH